MNVNSRRQSGILAVCLGISCLLVSGTRSVSAQTPRANPLRAAPDRTLDEPSKVQLAVANEPVRGQVRPPERVGSRTVAPASHQTHRPVAYGSRAPVHEPRGYVPRHELVSGMQTTDEIMMEPIPAGEPGDMTFSQLPGEGEVLDPNCCGDVVNDCAVNDCGGCGTCSGCLIPCPTLALNNFEFFAGVEGFTAPLNRGETGSFGFHYGANWAAPVPCIPNQPFGMQVGYRGVSANYSGASFTEDSREQSFITAGLFRRVDWGLQGGVVVDFLSDKWYYDDLSLTQIRGELSWVYPQCHELGFWFASGSKSNTAESITVVNNRRQSAIEEYESTDLFAFFYRRRFEAVGGGYGRLFAGFTGGSEGLIGGDFALPLTESWALRTGFTYLIPENGNNRVGYLEEAWNVGITLVWYPGCRKATGNDYFRPLFDVADNSNFIVRMLQQN